ncbi:MAG: VOC family protein [Thaumarchaeota archaeon]|nr:VOC family protein [Nitrososphaerota archaeon]MDG6905677.1 VOC family protein [Nitrososphaerota archaeon]
MIDHINAFVLPVRNVEKCALFSRDKLGFNLDQLENDEAYLTMKDKNSPVLALKSLNLVSKEISEERIRPQEENIIKRTHFVVFVSDVDKEFEDLKLKGVNFVNPPTTREGGWRNAHFEDPEGNLWEIAQRPRK